MANIKFSQFAIANPISGADEWVGLQGDVNAIGTWAQASTYISSNIDLNSAYSHTPSQTLNITSGLTIFGNSFELKGTDNSVDIFSGAYNSIFNPNDVGVFSSWAETQIRGTTTGTIGQFLWVNSYGFCYELIAGQESSFYSAELLDKGVVNNPFNLMGSTSAYTGTRLVLGGTVSNQYINSVDIGLGTNGTPQESALLQVYSSDQGVLFCPMSTTDINSISSPATGLEAFDTTQFVKKYFNGTDWATAFTNENVIEGTNISIVDNGNGTFTLNATGGGGSTPTPAFASFGMNNGTSLNNSVQTSFNPIIVTSGLVDINSSNFTNSLITVGGIQTAVSVYTGALTQYFIVNGTASYKISSIVSNNFYLTVSILKANGSVVTVQSINNVNLKVVNDLQDVAVNAIVQLDQGDGIFYQVRGDSGGNLIIPYLTSQISNMGGSNVTAGNYSPTLTGVAGVSGTPTLINANYSQSGNIVSGFVQFTAVVTSSTVQVGISLPIASAFTNANQAQGTGDMFITSSPGILDGKVQNVISDSTNARMTANIISANSSTTITASITFSYTII